jgi:hypothetical protein
MLLYLHPGHLRVELSALVNKYMARQRPPPACVQVGGMKPAHGHRPGSALEPYLLKFISPVIRYICGETWWMLGTPI